MCLWLIRNVPGEDLVKGEKHVCSYFLCCILEAVLNIKIHTKMHKKTYKNANIPILTFTTLSDKLKH